MAKTMLSDVIKRKSEHAQQRVIDEGRPQDILAEPSPMDTLVDPLGEVDKPAPWQGARMFRHLNEQTSPGKFKRGGSESQQNFRIRMSGEMSSLRQGMVNEDAKALDKRDPGRVYDLPTRFQDRQREQQDQELEALRQSKAVTSGSTQGSTALTHWDPGSKSFESDKDHKGKAMKVPTLSGGKAGALEQRLENPTSGTKVTVSPYGTKTSPLSVGRPRTGMSKRHQEILSAAHESDRLMGALDTTGELPMDYLRKSDLPYQHWKKRYVNDSEGVPRLETRENNSSPWQRKRIVGMDEFQNRPTRGGVLNANTSHAPERSLPKLKPHSYGSSSLANNAYKNKQNVWGEADLDYVSSQGFNSNTGRTASRLHYTSPNSRLDSNNQTVPFNYAVSTDHYESAVPITPVQTGYKAKAGYTGHTGPKSSLALHEETKKDVPGLLEKHHQSRMKSEQESIDELRKGGVVKGIAQEDARTVREDSRLRGMQHERMDELHRLTEDVDVPTRASRMDPRDQEERASIRLSGLKHDRYDELGRTSDLVDVPERAKGWDERLQAPEPEVSTQERSERLQERTTLTSGVNVSDRARAWDQRLREQR